MITTGLILLLIGLITNVSILYSLGIILVVVGVVLMLLGVSGRPVGRHRHYW
jgi:hypothetical protein